MRAIKPSTVLGTLARMEAVVKELPDDARIGRMFIVDDGQGVVLEKGIYKAAAKFEKIVEIWPGHNKDTLMLSFKVGELTVFELTDRARTDRAEEGKIVEKEMEEIVRCRDCVKRGTPECAMSYRCSVCGGQWPVFL